eukprot:jgi/Mesvir1/4783/Mv02309-RA.1
MNTTPLPNITPVTYNKDAAEISGLSDGRSEKFETESSGAQIRVSPEEDADGGEDAVSPLSAHPRASHVRTDLKHWMKVDDDRKPTITVPLAAPEPDKASNSEVRSILLKENGPNSSLAVKSLRLDKSSSMPVRPAISNWRELTPSLTPYTSRRRSVTFQAMPFAVPPKASLRGNVSNVGGDPTSNSSAFSKESNEASSKAPSRLHILMGQMLNSRGFKGLILAATLGSSFLVGLQTFSKLEMKLHAAFVALDWTFIGIFTAESCPLGSLSPSPF